MTLAIEDSTHWKPVKIYPQCPLFNITIQKDYSNCVVIENTDISNYCGVQTAVKASLLPTYKQLLFRLVGEDPLLPENKQTYCGQDEKRDRVMSTLWTHSKKTLLVDIPVCVPHQLEPCCPVTAERGQNLFGWLWLAVLRSHGPLDASVAVARIEIQMGALCRFDSRQIED